MGSESNGGGTLVRLQTATIEELYLPNKWMPFGAALTFHFMLFAWNPTIMSAANTFHPPELMQVQFREALPVVEPVKPKVEPPKPVEKKHVKKAHKSGLSITHHPTPVAITRHHVVAHPHPAPKRFVSKIEMPKFVPHASEDIVAASPSPGITAPAPHPATQALAPMVPLKSKTRGIRAQDINFQLSDRGSLASGERVMAIPVGQESGDTAVLPSAAVMHEAPKGRRTIQGFRFTPGSGTGSGELSGKNKGVYGYHGVVQADSYIEGSLSGGGGRGGHGKVIEGQGFELGGPVGDRKVMHRKLPEYPDWAEEKGISAMVKIYFTVQPDGTLRQSMRILRSSGYTELDDLAKQALRQWRFSPTTASSNEQEAWGVITFRFTLA